MMSGSTSLNFFSDDECTPHASSIDLKEEISDDQQPGLQQSDYLLQLDLNNPPLLKDENGEYNCVQVLPVPLDDKPIEHEQLAGKYFKESTQSRIVVVSWKVRQYSLLARATKPGVFALQYKSDSTLQSIISEIKNTIGGTKVISLALVCHGNPGCATICKDKILNIHSFNEDDDIKQFFKMLATEIIDGSNPNAHFDLLASSLLLSSDGQNVVQALQDLIKIPVIACKDILGTDSKKQDANNNVLGNVGELYFDSTLLRTWSGSAQSISNYEKIRTIGRGAYGTAVLYRKKDDDSLVVLKEVSILDLNATERQAAMNEVNVLAMLSHPNIISYYDSFDEDGTLWIEMEYADGGTLHDYLARQETDLEEREILIMFSQMVSAIKYCHDNHILHRDLKTQNIFLTQDTQVKLGDFGIAKIMTTRNAGNFTVVGTPYYISPEMCEGKPYDSKSDIWALGCILYEMANLTRTFDGTNLPALITKIVKGTFAPIKDTYSPEFRLLVRDLLQKDPNSRPDAEEILFNRLAELLQRYDDFDDQRSERQVFNYGRSRSLLYYCDVSQMQLYPIHDLPVKIQICEVSVGLAHVVVVSLERGIYTWGDNSYGQLGLGDFEQRDHATEVVLLRGKSIIRACCGDYFTTFLSDNGLILTCGQGDYGCLGHGDWETITRPKLIDELLTLDIASLKTGSYHQVITTAEGEAFTWGCGDDGRLGHGNEENCFIPKKVKFVTEHVFIKDVECSNDGTVFIADTGALFACGRNQGNKLGLNPRQGFLLQLRSKANKYVESAKVPTTIKDLCRYQISDIKFGATHFTVINDFGRVFTNGNNMEGQLGVGNSKPRETISVVKGLEDGPISNVACGSTFSFAVIQDRTSGKNTVNSVYFWGTKPKLKRQRSASNSDSFNLTRSTKSRKLSSIDDDSFISDPEASSSMRNSNDSESVFPGVTKKISVPDTSRKSATGRRSATERRSVGSDTSRTRQRGVLDDIGDTELDDIRKNYFRTCLKGPNTQTLNLVSKQNLPVVIPQLVFKFQSISGIDGYDESEEFPVILQDIKCFHDHVLIHLETTAPPPKKKKVLKPEKSFDSSLSSNNTKEESTEDSEMETSGEVPTWIRNELEAGIPVSDSTRKSQIIIHESAPLYVDESNDNEKDVKNKEISPLHQNYRSHSYDTLTRRGSIKQSRDPNFNIVPKLKKMGSMLRIKEDLSETRIIDGVAVTTSVAEIENSSPCNSEEEKPDENGIKNKLNSTRKFSSPLASVSPILQRKHGEVSARSSDEVEYTPVEKIEIVPTPRHSEDIVVPRLLKAPKEKPPFSKARIKRVQHNRDRTEAAYRPQKMNLRDRRIKEERTSSASDADDPKNYRKTKTKVEDEKNSIEKVERQAKLSEEMLRKEIQNIQAEKDEREEALKKMHELSIQQQEEENKKQAEETKKREELLKDEILNLKMNLNDQNSKLQDNYNILLSLQEQLLRMQQNELRNPQIKHSTQDNVIGEKQLESPSRKSTKSSVCVVM